MFEIHIVISAHLSSILFSPFTCSLNLGFANGKNQSKSATINIGYARSGDWIAIRINGQQVFSKAISDFQSGVHDGIGHYTVTV